jgi:hypothetical protein
LRDIKGVISGPSFFEGKIAEVIRKNWRNPMTDPSTMPPTMPQGDIPSRRSAIQPRNRVNATEPKKAIPADHAKPLRLTVSDSDEGLYGIGIKGSSVVT